MRAFTAAAVVVLAIVLGLVQRAPWADGPSTSEGQAPVQEAFAYEVLSGAGESRLSDGWHHGSAPAAGWTEGYALDFVGDYADGDPTVGKKVHAVFRHVSGPALEVRVTDDNLNCDGFAVELYEGSSLVATVQYAHTEVNPTIDIKRDKPEWRLATGRQTTSSGDATNLGKHLAVIKRLETKCPQWWTGSHLHQRVLVHGRLNAKVTRDSTVNSRGHADFADSRKWLGAWDWDHGSPSWVRLDYLQATTPGRAVIANTDGAGVLHRYACRDSAQTNTQPGIRPDDMRSVQAEGADVRVLEVGSDDCADWANVTTAPGWLCVATSRTLWQLWRGAAAPTTGTSAAPTTYCPSEMSGLLPTPTLTTRVDGACGTVSARLTDDSRRAVDEFVPGGIETRTWTFPHGSEVTVTARSTSSCTFDGLSGACTTDTNTYTCDVRMTEEREVTADFTRPDTHTLTLSASRASCAAMDATLVSNTSFFYRENNSMPKEWSVEQGASVTVTATVEDVRCTFVRWTGAGSNSRSEAGRNARDSSGTNCDGPSSCEVEMNDDRTVVAEFTYADTAPAFAADATPFTARFTVGVVGSVQLPEATGGNGGLTYSLRSIPAGLEFDSATAVLARKATTTGTMVAGTTTATLTVHDEDDNRASTDADTVSVTITVTAGTTTPPDTRPPDTRPPDSVCDDGTPPPCKDTEPTPTPTPTPTAEPETEPETEPEPQPTPTPTPTPTAEPSPTAEPTTESGCDDNPDTPDIPDCPKVDCKSGPDVPHGQTCPVVQCDDGSTVPDGGSCPTYSWTGVCTLTGSIGGGGPFSTPGAAQAAGNAWGATCPTTDLAMGVWKTTNYYATITCTNGTTFTVGPSTATGIVTLAKGALLACAVSSNAAGLSGQEVDRTALIAALQSVLDDESIQTSVAGLLPEEGITAGSGETTDEVREGFTTSVVNNQHHVAVTCGNGLSFTIRPAATIESALDDGAYGLLVCANAHLLTDLTVPESLTRAQLQELVQGALAALPTPAEESALRMAPSRVQHERVTKQSGTYSIYSVDTWHWSASCTNSSNRAVSGGGSTSTQSAASAAVLSWVSTASCKVGTALISVSP